MFKNFILTKRLFQFTKKRINKTSQDSGAIYRTMTEHSVIGMYIIQDNYFRYVNDKWCEISGYTYEEAVDTINFLNIVYSEDRKTVEQSQENLLLGNTNSQKIEFRVIRKDKETIWLRVQGKTMIYRDKQAIYGICEDITKQKEIETALFVNEERLRLAIETAQIGIWDWDLENDIWYASPIYYTMLGYDPVTGPSDREIWLKRVHEDDREQVKEKINAMLIQRQNQYSYEARMLHADGSYRWIHVIGHIIDKDDQGRIKRMYGIRKDITDFKQAGEELKKSQKRLRTLINTIPDLIWLKDPQGVYLQCNHRFELLYGVPEKEIVGKTDYDFVSKELADFFRQKDNNAERAGKPSVNEEELTFADGHKEIMETVKTPMYESDGNFIGILGIGRDITERKNTVANLIKNQILLRDSQRIANMGCWDLDIKTGNIFWNEDAYGIYGVNDLTLQPSLEIFNQLVHPDDRWIPAQHYPEMIKNKVFNDFECRVIKQDGTIISILVAGDVELDEQGEVKRIFGIVQDITKKKRTEQELKEYRESLERLVQERTEELEATIEKLHATNEELTKQKEKLQNSIDSLNSTREQLIQSEKMASLGILSSGIAHEINNPLNFIHGGSVALEKYCKSRSKDSEAEISPYLNAIKEGVKRASQIVSSLGHYSRSDDLPVIECNVHSIIDNCLVMLQSRLKSKVTVSRQYTGKKYTLLGNEGKLHQAILNVISNAEQAIKNEGTINIETDVKSDQFSIEIQDTGEGMDQKTMDRIFDPFFTTKGTGKGTGLGLYITYNIIREHNGEIKCESEINKGTKVSIKLPISK